MVLISDKKKYIFIHIPKTGGMTIKETIKSQDKDIKNMEKIKLKYNINNYFYISREYHYTYNELKNYLQNDFNNYFKFAFVRNPYDRLYSAIEYIKKKNLLCDFPFNIQNFFIIFYTILIFLLVIKRKYLLLAILPFFKIYILLIKVKFKDFNYIVKNYFKYIYKYIPFSFRPQYEYIENSNIDFIGRMENFDNDFKFILNKFNYKIDIKNTNISNKNNSNKNSSKYINKFNKETIDFVNKFYDKDFKEFNYKKIYI
tara:strand:- start:222 stop:992 length:771 start_codon:yes stop_codon:yes gene_type:complete